MAPRQDVKDKLRRDFVSAYLAELAVWPAFQAFNFAKVCPSAVSGRPLPSVRQLTAALLQVPVRHQLLMVNLACLGDATFLCWCAGCQQCARCCHTGSAADVAGLLQGQAAGELAGDCGPGQALTCLPGLRHARSCSSVQL